MTSQKVAKHLFDALIAAGTTKAGACAVLGNVQAESLFIPNNLENTYNTKFGMTDEQYTTAVDNGTYTNFVNDSAGYGLAQWTYWSRKQKLLNYKKSQNKSIGDLELQINFLIKEFKEDFSSIWNQLKTSTNLYDLTWILLDKWENPAVKNISVRYQYAQNWFNTLNSSITTQSTQEAVNKMTIEQAREKLLAVARAELNYHEGYNNYIKYAEGSWDNQFYGWDLQNQPWCDVFVDYCFTHAFTMQEGAAMTYQTVGRGSALCKTSAAYYKNNNAFYSYPEVGDQVFFYYGGDINHTGIIESVQGEGNNWTSITTIEGNSNDQVSRNTYRKGNSIIAGFGRPKWSIVTGSSTIPSTTASTTTSTSTPAQTSTTTVSSKLQVGDKVRIKPGSKYYNSSITIPDFVINDTWIVLSINGDRVVINKNASGTHMIMSPINKADIITEATASVPATPTQPSTTIDSGNTYIVKAGDSFWKIAAEQLGNGLRYGEILKLNNMKATTIIHPGDVLKLPSK